MININDLKFLTGKKQIITVAADGTAARFCLYEKSSDMIWQEILCTDAFIGRNGIGKEKEGDGKTPAGIFGFNAAFGNKPNPGTALDYICTDSSYYWVDDCKSAYYNQLVSVKDVKSDWNSAEHIASIGAVYNYVLSIDYNKERLPGIGSAIFLHCSSGVPTAGCVAIPEDKMKELLQKISADCAIMIDSEKMMDCAKIIPE